MGNKEDDKKVGAIGTSGATKGVKATESLSEVDKVKGASAVKGVSEVSGVGRSGAIGAVSIEQRDKLMAIVTEEAEKLAAQGVLSKSQRDVVEQAVKMAIDASLIEASETRKR